MQKRSGLDVPQTEREIGAAGDQLSRIVASMHLVRVQ